MKLARALTTTTQVACLLAGHASAQVRLSTHYGDDSFDQLGQSVSAAGDVNGDGVPDYIGGSDRDATNGNNAGFARVFSGLDGSVLHTFYGGGASDSFGAHVAGAGDVDADGFDDLIVGSRYHALGDPTGNAQVLSGLDGSVLHTFSLTPNANFLPTAVAGVGDVNADGHDDLLIGDPVDGTGANNGGTAVLYSGLDGSALHSFPSSVVGQRKGYSVGCAGDVDMDGVPDLIVGSLASSVAGAAWVYSGADGSELHQFTSGTTGDRFAFSVAGAGDVDGDGYDDVVVGAPFDSTGASSGGRALIYSGADGTIVHDLVGTTSAGELGYFVRAAGDVDGDGLGDFLVGMDNAPGTYLDNGQIQIHSGATGGVLHRLRSKDPGDFFGRVGDVVGDVDGDGSPDFVGGAYATDLLNVMNVGAVIVLTLQPVNIRNYCASSPNTTGVAATMDSTGYASLVDDDLALFARDVPPGAAGLFFTGQNQKQNPFGNGFRCIGAPFTRINPLVSADASGLATSPPVATWFLWTVGSTWNYQFWYRDPTAPGATFNLTDGLEVTFIP